MNTYVKLMLGFLFLTSFSMTLPTYLSQEIPTAEDMEVTDLSTSKKVLYVRGTAESLIIKGTDTQSVSTDLSDASISEISVDGDKVNLLLKTHTVKVLVEVPHGIKVVCDMEGIQNSKGRLELREDQDDYRSVSFIDLSGDVEFDGDGYHVDVEGHSGSLDILTYGHVNADLKDLPKGEKIDIDTYQGNVLVKLAPLTDANLNLTTKKGKVILNHLYQVLPQKFNKKKFIGVLNDGGPEIKLHSENGATVMLSSKMN